MPPRQRGTDSSRGTTAGRGRGGAPPGVAPRGGSGSGAVRGGGRGGAARGAAPTALRPLPAAVKPIGVARTGFGTAGRAIKVRVNALSMPVPVVTVFHYDAMNKTFRPKYNRELIGQLQAENRDIFQTFVSYDGKKNIYTVDDYGFDEPNFSRSFTLVINQRTILEIKLTRVRVIDTTTLQRFVGRQQSWDENVATALTALNIAAQMLPSQNFPSRLRSFYNIDPASRRPVGNGLEAVRGYFQSIRPTFDRLLINVDISTGVMYRAGPLIELCLDYFGLIKDSPLDVLNSIGQGAIPDVQRLRLQRFLTNLSVEARTVGGDTRTFSIYQLTREGASAITFDRNGVTSTVAAYFAAGNQPLRFPHLICAKTRAGVVIPLERCVVPPGQLARVELQPDSQRLVVEFATQRPADRLTEIRKGMNLLQYGQSEYVKAFGMQPDMDSLPLAIDARVLNPPSIQYIVEGKLSGMTPRDGAWNMRGKKFVQPATIDSWIIMIFDQRFPDPAVEKMKRDFVDNCSAVGMKVNDTAPLWRRVDPRGNIITLIQDLGTESRKAKGKLPMLVLCVLPDNQNADIYRMIKYWGDMVTGVATQCVKRNNASSSKAQFWANVMLKLNAKLGGINAWPDVQLSVMLDPAHPAIIMGADVMHPAPGSDQPSYAAVVGSVDYRQSRYISRTKLQSSRQEMIADLESMAAEILISCVQYRTHVETLKRKPQPERLIFFRDGVSEGEFGRVLDQELPLLQAACIKAKITPKITFIVVGKRHHIRFFPNSKDGEDRSGNVQAGTVIDKEITSPLEYDFYLQSHAGILGTSRSSHYTVVHDENNLGPDALQALAYTLCHTYARATRSVSIPAPVYYAHIVCSRAKTHYDPSHQPAASVISGGTMTSAEKDAAKARSLQAYAAGYKSVHEGQKRRMYFM